MAGEKTTDSPVADAVNLALLLSIEGRWLAPNTRTVAVGIAGRRVRGGAA
ncbi:hypothetical protein [Arthrobacter sp. H35-D1]|nr:hypothetical protein [Arthrobacter sp. H35-D1]MDJ0311769.1 hypothetical protein [Arthrobacter sp. H35-D1]